MEGIYLQLDKQFYSFLNYRFLWMNLELHLIKPNCSPCTVHKVEFLLLRCKDNGPYHLN